MPHHRLSRISKAGRKSLFRTVAALAVLFVAACGNIPGPSSTPSQRAGLESKYIDIGAPLNIRLHYLRAGDPAGRRVIFVHGTPGSAYAFTDYLVNVPPGFEFISIDRPGFGKSGPEGAVVSLERQALALRPLLVTRGGKKPILVGHSLGGPIIARAAVDNPGKIGGLVIAAGSLDPDLEEVQLVQHVAEVFGLSYLVSRKLRNANRELIGLKKHLVLLQPRLKDIRCPVVIVHGTKDDLVPYKNVAFMRRHLTGSARITVVRLDGTNHFLPWNSKAALDRSVALLDSGEMPRCAA